MENNKITNRPLVLISVMLAMFVGAVEATIVTTAMPVNCFRSWWFFKI